MVYQTLFPAMWLAWVTYWCLMSRNVKRSSRIESLGSRLLHLVPLGIAALLLGLGEGSVPWLNSRVIPWALWEFWLGALLTAAGLLFAVWARRHLGRNWSATVTVKQDHALVESGPYALVRHPIYTGLLLALIGSALALGEWRGVLAVLIVLWAFWRKLQLEELWMVEQFGERYQAYRRRVRALIPFLW
jgi:protein-S-isoprenylcysteine O-methyltransferase Ste14